MYVCEIRVCGVVSNTCGLLHGAKAVCSCPGSLVEADRSNGCWMHMVLAYGFLE
jgi:hypothetical protein